MFYIGTDDLDKRRRQSYSTVIQLRASCFCMKIQYVYAEVTSIIFTALNHHFHSSQLKETEGQVC